MFKVKVMAESANYDEFTKVESFEYESFEDYVKGVKFLTRKAVNQSLRDGFKRELVISF